MTPNNPLNITSQREFSLCAATFFAVSLIPIPFLFWAYFHTHGFKDLSETPKIATEVSLNALGLLIGLIISSAFIGKVVAPFILTKRSFKLFLSSVLVGIIWSVPTFSGVWMTLAIYGFANQNFTPLKNAFNFEEIASGFIVIPILLNIPLAVISTLIFKKVILRSRTMA